MILRMSLCQKKSERNLEALVCRERKVDYAQSVVRTKTKAITKVGAMVLGGTKQTIHGGCLQAMSLKAGAKRLAPIVALDAMTMICPHIETQMLAKETKRNQRKICAQVVRRNIVLGGIWKNISQHAKETKAHLRKTSLKKSLALNVVLPTLRKICPGMLTQMLA